MSTNDDANESTDRTARSINRRGFMKVGAAGAVAGGFGLELNSLATADDGRDELVEHTGEWRPSCCQGCTSWCSAQILVDDRTGRALKTQGHPESRVHGNNDCPRQDLSIQQLYDPDRITQPMRRTNPEKGPDEDPAFEPISWEEAIGDIADEILELRENEEPHKFMLTRGRYTFLNSILYGNFPQLVGSPNNISHSAICAEAEKAGPMFTEGEWDYRQYDVTETEYLIAWGADPVSANRQVSHYMGEWGDLLDRGEIAVVEPRLSSTAAKSDEWLPVEPGTDGALASAIAHVLLRDGLWYREFVGDFADDDDGFVEGEEVDPDAFDESENVTGVVDWWNLELNDKTPEWAEEETGVPAEQIERVATRFGEARPHAISWLGGGPCMQVRGTYTSMAVHALNGLVGSAGNRGGTLYHPETATAGLPDPDEYVDDVAERGLDHEIIDQRGRLEFPSLSGGEPGAGVVTNNAADAIIDEDPNEIEVLLSYWNNFAFSNPENQRWIEALSKIPFHATIETHPSETAWFADIVLPATHHQYERWGLASSSGNGYVSLNLQTPVMADDPDDPEDVLENGRLWDSKTDETEVTYLLAEALADRGFENVLEYLENEYPDPETGTTVREEYPGDDFAAREKRAQAFARNAVKTLTQPIWDPEIDHDLGEQLDGWEEFRERGIWHTDHWEYRHRWPSEGGEFDTDTGTFEFYSETLENALEEHAENHDTDVDEVLDVCKYQARTDGDQHAFVPHYEEPYELGDEAEYPYKFVDYKSGLNREGRSANCTWYHEFADVDPGSEPHDDLTLLNPRDAEDLGVENGDTIRISSPVGEIEGTVKLWEGIRPGAIGKPYGMGHWAYGQVASEEFGDEAKGSHNNTIIGAEYDRLSGSSAYYGGVRVAVEVL